MARENRLIMEAKVDTMKTVNNISVHKFTQKPPYHLLFCDAFHLY